MLPQLIRPAFANFLANTIGRVGVDKPADGVDSITLWVRFARWRRSHPAPQPANRRDRNDRVWLYETVIRKEGLDQAPITYLEFGVYRGASLCWWLSRVRDPDSRFVGFDTFTGLPERASRAEPMGAFDAQGELPETNDPRCSFQVGLFQDKLPDFIAEADLSNRLVIHLDADLFTSTLFVLTSLAPRLKRDDIVFFDNFICTLSEYHAFDEFVRSFRVSYEVLGAVGEYTRVCIKIA
jgi:O-methyltransferase